MNTDFFDDRVQIFTVERSVYPPFKDRFPTTSMPKFLFYKGGEEIMEIVGVDAPKLLNGINQYMPALVVEE
jgi:hypothetical protein